MLYSLSVSNYILIGSLDTTFPAGLIIISGETGAGKSILLGALSLVLGAKADASMVGPAGENCIVEAEFGITPSVRRILKEADLPDEGDRLILRRTVGQSGRSRSFANDEPVTLPVLQDLARELVDIHSQHQTLRLADEKFRIDALDLFAGCSQLREQTLSAQRSWQAALHALEALREKKALALRDQEYNRSRWQRLQDARLTPGELETLDAEQKQLADWLLKQGVDHIIGGHPHVPQPIELRNNGNTLVAYSLGNYISNQARPNTYGGVMVRMELSKKGNKAKLDNAGYCLYFVSRPAESGRKNFRIYSINTPDSMLNARERERRNTFAASIRNLFKQHNKGNIKEYKF